MTEIKLSNLKKAYGNTVVIENLNLVINSGERLVLLGPSGCGKSTILRMIAGLETVTAGNIKFDNLDMNNIHAGEREVSMVFQNYALYPHMTVEENIGFGLKCNGMAREEINKLITEVSEPLGLKQYLHRKPFELSGGQRQRVALARATVKKSNVFLLDEPLSNLDVQLRSSARKTLLELHHIYNQTMVYVTHDQTEAMTFGHRIALLNGGDLMQVDTPDRIYYNPRNIFTAKFIGTPAMNILENVEYYNGMIIIGNQTLKLNEEWYSFLGSQRKNISIGLRPESIKLTSSMSENSLCGRIIHFENHGSYYMYHVDIEGNEVLVENKFKEYRYNQEVCIELDQTFMNVFDSEKELNIGYPESIERIYQEVQSEKN